MAFIVTGAYIAALFGAGMWFIYRRGHGNDRAKAAGAGSEGSAESYERRQGERRHVSA